ncbi:MAG: ASKHA domain-containing protein [Thermodesulfovibrionales bacterium]
MEARLTSGKSIPVRAGQSLLQSLKDAEVYLVASCGGKGTCGKCKVRLIEGDAAPVSFGKLTRKEREAGAVLACQCYPKGDVLIEIPEGSRLVVGDKIAVARTRDLFELFEAFGVAIKPVVSVARVKLPPPTIEDSISDLERLRRALRDLGLDGMRFSHRVVSSLARTLREAAWDVELGYIEGPEAMLITPAGHRQRYGVAVDIGTTTVVAYLVDLLDGRILEAASTYNSQIRHGDDVITRIVHATEGGGLAELRDAVAGDINELVRVMTERHGVKPSEVESAVVSGNTTMAHLFWGLDPSSIREEPYIPTVNSFPLWRAGTARLRINPQAPVYTFPAVASYVGGDIVSGVMASRMHRSAETALFMDIGTNGEIAVGNSEFLITAACSAGPCFEGSGIRHGMRATEGAVEGVRIDPATFEPELRVIGSARPAGICGSGMIDAVSEMFLTGVIDQRGKFVRDIGTPRIRDGEDGAEYVFFSEGDTEIALTEVDIENILRAKAAIYAGVNLLLKEIGLTPEDLQRVYIAGGFGVYLNVERAVTLGMLPDLPIERFSFLGNTSVAGAYLALLSADLRKEAEEIASKMTYVELSVSRAFMDEYMSALFLPHTDMGKFPSVQKLMGQRR